MLSRFRFEDGLIVEHIDSFSFYAWSRQSMGRLGATMGWTPLLRNMVRAQGRRGLDEFLGRPAVAPTRGRR